MGGTTSSQLANVTTVTPIAAPQYAPVKFVSDNETSYRPAAQDIKSFDAVVYLSSVYDKFAHKGAVAYYIVPRGNEKNLSVQNLVSLITNLSMQFMEQL